MPPRPPLVFVTGTDTGVGKTVVTAYLVHHMRQTGLNAVGLKPFSSGGRGDAEVLHAVQGDTLTLDEINPFSFSRPVTPLVAARCEGRRIQLDQALRAIGRVLPRCQRVVIEGCGGLLSPLGENFALTEIMVTLGGNVIVVAPDKLGVINQVLLTVKALPKTMRKGAKVVLMRSKMMDQSAATNAEIIGEFLGPKSVFLLPFSKNNPLIIKNLQKCYKKFKKTLAACGG